MMIGAIGDFARRPRDLHRVVPALFGCEASAFVASPAKDKWGER